MGSRIHSMGNENPPRKLEGEKTFIVVEEKGRGFTVVDENKEHYLWQDEDKQVLWTKDIKEAHAKRDELQKKELEERTTPSQEKTMIPEDLQKLKDKEAEVSLDIEKEKAFILSQEEELRALENEGKTTLATSPTPQPASTSTSVSDQEKLEQIRKELLGAERKANKELKAQRELTHSAIEQERNIEQARSEYIDAYGNEVKNVNGLKKFGYKIANFLGIKSKDAFVDTNKKNQYAYQKNWKGEHILNNFVGNRVEERIAERENKDGRERTDEEVKALKERYKQFISNTDTKEEKIEKLTGKWKGWSEGRIAQERLTWEKELKDSTPNQAFSNHDLGFVERENMLLRTEKEMAWEANRSAQEKWMHAQAEKATELLDRNPKIKKALGNKWFRLGATSVGMGLFTGGIGSVAFWGSRAVRVAGGMLGAGAGKMIGDKWIKTAETIAKKESELKQDYENGYLTASQYDKRVEGIELLKIKLERAKNALTIGLGAGVGYSAGLVDAHFIHTGTDNNVHTTKEHTETEHSHETQKTEPVQKTPNTKTPMSSTAPTTPTEAPAPVQINDDWLVHKGEGVEHTFIRQIEQSEELQKLLGYKEGMNLHDFAGKAAHEMALSNGYADNIGNEIRITGAGIDKAGYELRINNGAVEIHEHFDGKEIETHTGNGTGIEKNIEDTKAEGGYETLHDKSHPVTHTAKHIATLREEIDNAYPKREHFEMEALKPVPVGPAHLEPIKVGPNGIIATGATEPIKVGPNGPIGPQPEPIKVGPAGPTNTAPAYEPRLPHTHGEPRTYGDPMHNGRYHRAEPDAGRNQYNESRKVSSIGGNTAEENLAQNSAPAGKDFFTILAEAFFGKDTPEVPQMTATPGGNFDDLSKAA